MPTLKCELCAQEFSEERTSNCCDAKLYPDTDLCTACNDHCEAINPDWDSIDETGRCSDCVAEWGDQWPDRV